MARHYVGTRMAAQARADRLSAKANAATPRNNAGQ